YAIEPGALLGQEARVLLVCLPVAQVDGFVRDVPVAAQDELPSLALERREVRQQDVEKAELRGLALGARRARRQVQRYDREIAEARLEKAPLVVELTDAEAARDRIGLAARI